MVEKCVYPLKVKNYVKSLWKITADYVCNGLVMTYPPNLKKKKKTTDFLVFGITNEKTFID